MTATQIFIWFCKEQRIMHNIRKMYYEIQPHKYKLIGGIFSKEFIDFDEYILTKVKHQGFSGLMERIFDDYCNSFRTKMPYAEYYPLCCKIFKDNRDLFKRWNYFVNNNIILNDSRIKVNSTVKYKSWHDFQDFIIESIDIAHGMIYGTVVTNDESLQTAISFSNLICNDFKPLEIVFSIKRNRRIYNGKN